VLCALCADVCPVDVISLVPSEELGAAPGGTALLIDEERCIRCALCIERCPPDALSMGMWKGIGRARVQPSPSPAPLVSSEEDRFDDDHRTRAARSEPAEPGPDRADDLIDKVRDTPVGKSIFRSPRKVTPRDRAAGHWASFLLHIYPVKIRRASSGSSTRGTSA
jgi:ferredoxin